MAQQTLANWNNRGEKEMQPLVAFFNLAAFFASHLMEMVRGVAPDAPMLIEVPTSEMEKNNPMAMEAMVSVVLSGMEATNRPMVLVKKDETGDGTQDVIERTRSTLELYSPVAATQFTKLVVSGQIQVTMADEILFKGGKFQLKAILASAFRGQSITSALVFGDEAHFDAQGTSAEFKNYFTLAARFAELLREKILFAIQA